MTAENQPEILMKPDDWLETEEFNGFLVMDPDGWDRQNFEESWNEPISSKVMWERLAKSTTGRKSPTA